MLEFNFDLRAAARFVCFRPVRVTTIIVIAGLVAGCSTRSPDMFPSGDTGVSVSSDAGTEGLSISQSAVKEMVREAAARKLGEEYVPIALNIAKAESRFHCGLIGPRTKYGRARGALQVLPSTYKSLGYSSLHGCGQEIEAGVDYMKVCIGDGFSSAANLAMCYVQGAKYDHPTSGYAEGYVSEVLTGKSPIRAKPRHRFGNRLARRA